VAKLILLIAVALALYIAIKRAQSQPPHKRRAAYLQTGLIATLIAAVVLAAMGKMHWLGAAITGLFVALKQSLPAVIRYFPLLNTWWQKRQMGVQGQQSELRTDVLRMMLDHDTGELNGEVLQGPFAGWLLRDMSRAQLDELQDYCVQHDSDAAQLVESYIEQRFGTQNQNDDTHDHSATPPDGSMNETEALAILGLEPGADKETIIDAHRRLMQKIHPDRGGNDYLAAKINEAKAYLLARCAG
jgi:DnaJ-domain-containing protein 1